MNEITNVNQEVINYSKEQLNLIRDIYAKKATDTELQLLMYMSKKYNLDILSKQIWCVKFNDSPAQIYAGRDGFLEIGHRSGMFDGMETKITLVEEPFTVEYFAWENKVKVKKTYHSDYQYVATCIVYRKDMSKPITVEVYEEEYSTGQGLWQTKRRTMISKVAESQALRKAFSITGLYAQEEMGQPEVIIDESSPTVAEIVEIEDISTKLIAKNKIDSIKECAQRKGINQKSICAAYGIETFDEMNTTQWKEAMDKLSLRPDKKANALEGVI